MSEQRINLQGAVDLAALAASRKAQEQRQAQLNATDGQPDSQQQNQPTSIIDVSMERFEEDVLKQSLVVPVVLIFGTARSDMSLQLTQTLEKLARDDQGSWVLGKIDVDSAAQLVTAFQIQAVPTVFAVIGGQPVPLFQGAIAEHKIREVIDAVLAQAKQLGLSGHTDTAEPTQEQPLDPRLEKAQQAMDDGEWNQAVVAYQELLSENPNDSIAKIGLLNVQLFARVDGVDFDQAISTTDQSIESQLLAADCEFMMNDWNGAFSRLINVIGSSSSGDRDVAKARLFELFDIAGPNDSAVLKARTALSNALF